ncbi:MAG: YraN family protein [Acidobacteriaceae bacterium]|nr:YraN family protein [Acidobacteriaceae bacterium]
MATGSSERVPWSLTPKQLLWKLSDKARQFKEGRTLTPEAALGRRGEDFAHRYLRSAGMTILARNYRPGGGEAEVDIIARDGDITVFVEVKSRRSADYGSPDRQIDENKRCNITRAARSYAARAGITWNQVRFDVVSVIFTEPPSVVHQQDAFFEGRVI